MTLGETSAARTIDAGGKILMPGLINMHAHCADTLFRGLVENRQLEEWLQNVWKAQSVVLGEPENCAAWELNWVSPNCCTAAPPA